MADYSISKATNRDAAEIARLANQLGYPTTVEVMQGRLGRLLGSSIDVVFVAESGDGGLAGWIHGVLSQFLESDHRVEIGGLVVDEKFQRRGVGRELVKQVEAWAKEQGVAQASVRCRTERAEAHRFYEELGFKRAKMQVVFRKALP